MVTMVCDCCGKRFNEDHDGHKYNEVKVPLRWIESSRIVDEFVSFEKNMWFCEECAHAIADTLRPTFQMSIDRLKELFAWDREAVAGPAKVTIQVSSKGDPHE